MRKHFASCAAFVPEVRVVLMSGFSEQLAIQRSGRPLPGWIPSETLLPRDSDPQNPASAECSAGVGSDERRSMIPNERRRHAPRRIPNDDNSSFLKGSRGGATRHPWGAQLAVVEPLDRERPRPRRRTSACETPATWRWASHFDAIEAAVGDSPRARREGTLDRRRPRDRLSDPQSLWQSATMQLNRAPTRRASGSLRPT